MTNPLLLLKTYGQSVWYDNIDRAQLASGQFKRLLDEDGVVGVTANPTIFQKSISHGNAYDFAFDGAAQGHAENAVIGQAFNQVAFCIKGPAGEDTRGYGRR